MKLIAACLLIIMGAHAQNSMETTSRIELDRSRMLCGSVLANVRALFCIENDDDAIQKQSIRHSIIGAMLPENDQENFLSPYLAQRHGALAMSRGKRDREIIEKCCYKPCYMSEILQYC